MPGRAIVAPISFGDTSLPKIDITYIAPLIGATYDFAVDQLPLGPVASWPNLVDGVASFVADGATMPTAITDGPSKTLRFNGTIDRMKLPLNMNTAHSVVVVAKLRAPVANDQIFFGSGGNTEGAIGVNSAATGYTGYGGGNSVATSPAVLPDTGWHVFILSHQGSGSAVRIDAAETPGTLTVAQRNGITLGFSSAAGNRAAIDYKRVAVIPGTMTTAQRTAIVAQMKAQYGI